MTDSQKKQNARRPDERANEILDAALRLFIEKGFAATPVDEIARAARISKGAVYLYFPSKDAILEGLVKRAVSPFAEGIVQRLEAADESHPRQVITDVMHSFRRAARDENLYSVPMLVIREAPGSPEIASIYRQEILDHVLPALGGYLRRARSVGALRNVDPDMAVRSIIGPIIAHFLLAKVFGVIPKGGPQVDAFLENHITILFDGLTPAGAEQ